VTTVARAGAAVFDTISGTYGKILQPMRIMVNGEAREAPQDCSVASLLAGLGIRTEQVAVELNLQILDRGAFGRTYLQEGDRVELIGFVGGGKP
jgi:sulfur carrier protein